MITLEDINTWLMKYEYQTFKFTIDCSQTGDHGIYTVVSGGSTFRQFRMNLPVNVRLYYPQGSINYNESTDLCFIRYGDYKVTVVLDSASDDETVVTKFGNLDWRPVSPTKCLSLPRDSLSHRKLYLEIKDTRITSINYKDIKDRDTNPYITYGDVASSLSDDVLWSNIDEGSRYPFKMIDIPSCPHITVKKSLYRGNNNNLDDLINLSSKNIEYTIYYQGKELDGTLFIPRDYTDDTIRLRVVTKSYEPFVGTDVYINVPVETKALDSLDDLNNYTYGYVDELTDITGEINSPLHLIGDENSSITNANLIINADVVFENITEISNSKIIINNSLEVTNSKLTPFNQFLFDNNGRLTITDCTSDEAQNLILNKGTLNILNSEFGFNSTRNYPFIHSEVYPNLQGNNFNYTDSVEGYGICIIRTNEMNTDDFLKTNNTNYNCNYTNDETEYTVTGNGIAYCQIDNDTITFTQLEVNN